MGKTYTGIDIGASSMKIAVCDGLTIKDIATAALPEGLIADDRIVSLDATADFIKETISGLSGIAKDAAFVIPESSGITRTLSLPMMTEKELALNLPYEFRDFITDGKDKYTYDYAVLSTSNDESGTPTSMNLLAVAARKDTIQDYVEMFRRAGLRLKIVLPSVAALQNLMWKNQKAKANCCIIDFSQKETQLYFFKNGAFDVSRVIDVGISNIVRVVAQEKSVDERIANEYVQSNFEGSLDTDQVRSVYDRIAVEVGRAVNFYGFNNPDTTIEVVYYCGGGSFVGNLLTIVEDHIDIDMQDVATIMPPAQANSGLRTICPAAIGATME